MPPLKMHSEKERKRKKTSTHPAGFRSRGATSGSVFASFAGTLRSPFCSQMRSNSPTTICGKLHSVGLRRAQIQKPLRRSFLFFFSFLAPMSKKYLCTAKLQYLQRHCRFWWCLHKTLLLLLMHRHLSCPSWVCPLKNWSEAEVRKQSR